MYNGTCKSIQIRSKRGQEAVLQEGAVLSQKGTQRVKGDALLGMDVQVAGRAAKTNTVPVCLGKASADHLNGPRRVP